MNLGSEITIAWLKEWVWWEVIALTPRREPKCLLISIKLSSHAGKESYLAWIWLLFTLASDRDAQVVIGVNG